jgi:hypothetical protein
MAEQTLKPSLRKWTGVALVVGISLALVVWWILLKTSFSGVAVYSGLALFGLMVILALFNSRKKIPFLPLLRASTWLKGHQYLGYLSIVLFLVHVDFRVPNGMLESILATVFGVVSISGIVGLFLSRQLPKAMTRSGETLLFERIPRHREEIRESVRKLIVESETSCHSSTLSEFYFEHMRHYLEERPGILRTFGMAKRKTSYRLLKELDSCIRYLSEEEKTIALELREWIATKENLDYQESSQRILKGWLFVHIPLTASLLLLGIAHGVLAMIYGGQS